MNKEEPEYTEVYTFKEKVPMMGKVLIGGLLFLTIYKLWFFPIQKQYLDTMHFRIDYVFELKMIFHLVFGFLALFTMYLIHLGNKFIKYKRFPLGNKSEFKR